MRARKWIVVSLCGVLIGGLAVGLYAQGRAASVVALPATGLPAAQAGSGFPQLTRLQVDVFELKCTNDALARLDLLEIIQGSGEDPDVQRGASVTDVLNRLREIGPTRLAVRFDNFIDLLAGCRLLSGHRIPAVENMVVNGNGVIVPRVSYEKVGFLVDVKGHWREGLDNVAEIGFAVESSDLSEKSLEVSPGVNLPTFEAFQSQQQLLVRTGQPVMLACNDLSAPSDDQGQSTVLIVRFVATRLSE